MKKFKIKKGNYRCNWFWIKFFNPKWNNKKWILKFTIYPSNWWTPPRDGDKSNVNRIYGIGFGLNTKNSWQLVQIPIFGKSEHFRIYAYIYDGNKLVKKQLIEVKARKTPYEIQVESINDVYIFSSKELGFAKKISNIFKDWKLQFDLYPHAGLPAAKDLYYNINMNHKK